MKKAIVLEIEEHKKEIDEILKSLEVSSIIEAEDILRVNRSLVEQEDDQEFKELMEMQISKIERILELKTKIDQLLDEATQMEVEVKPEVRTNEDLLELFEKLKLLPNFFERHLVEFYNNECRNTDVNDHNIENLYLASERLSQETEISSDQLKNAINQVIQKSKGNELTFEDIKTIKPIFGEIRPLNIYKTERIINSIKEESEQIKGKDLFLLLGPTGSGKSLILHYLCGSKLAKSSIIGHLKPMFNINNPSVLNIFSTSPSSESETSRILHYDLNLKSVGGDNVFLTLCDTPGFNDTRGPEVDLANGLEIAKSIISAKSVKIGLLFDFKATGPRMEYLRQNIENLGKLIKDFQNIDESLLFIFKRFDDETFKSLPAILKDLKNSFKSNEEENFRRLVYLIIEKLEDTKSKQIHRLNVEDENPLPLLEKIVALRNLKNPKEHFRTFINFKANQGIYFQLRILEKKITNSLARNEYNIVTFCLEELKLFKTILVNSCSIGLVLENCLKEVEEYLKSIYSEYENAMQNIFSLDNRVAKLQESLIKKVFCLSANLLDSQNLHLEFPKQIKEELCSEDWVTGIIFKYYSALEQNIEKLKLEVFAEKADILNDMYILIQALDNHFKPYKSLLSKYNNILTNKFGTFLVGFEKEIQEKSFENALNTLKKLRIIGKALGENYKSFSEEVEYKYEKFIAEMNGNLNNVEEKILNLLKDGKSKLGIQNKTQIIDSLNSLKNAISLLEGHKDMIKLPALQKRFNSVIEFIKKELNDKDDTLLECLKDLFQNKESRDNYLRVLAETEILRDLANVLDIQSEGDKILDKAKIEFDDKVSESLKGIKKINMSEDPKLMLREAEKFWNIKILLDSINKGSSEVNSYLYELEYLIGEFRNKFLNRVKSLNFMGEFLAMKEFVNDYQKFLSSKGFDDIFSDLKSSEFSAENIKNKVVDKINKMMNKFESSLKTYEELSRINSISLLKQINILELFSECIEFPNVRETSKKICDTLKGYYNKCVKEIDVVVQEILENIKSKNISQTAKKLGELYNDFFNVINLYSEKSIILNNLDEKPNVVKQKYIDKLSNLCRIIGVLLEKENSILDYWISNIDYLIELDNFTSSKDFNSLFEKYRNKRNQSKSDIRRIIEGYIESGEFDMLNSEISNSNSGDVETLAFKQVVIGRKISQLEEELNSELYKISRESERIEANKNMLKKKGKLKNLLSCSNLSKENQVSIELIDKKIFKYALEKGVKHLKTFEEDVNQMFIDSENSFDFTEATFYFEFCEYFADKTELESLRNYFKSLESLEKRKNNQEKSLSYLTIEDIEKQPPVYYLKALKPSKSQIIILDIRSILDEKRNIIEDETIKDEKKRETYLQLNKIKKHLTEELQKEVEEIILIYKENISKKKAAAQEIINEHLHNTSFKELSIYLKENESSISAMLIQKTKKDIRTYFDNLKKRILNCIENRNSDEFQSEILRYFDLSNELDENLSNYSETVKEIVKALDKKIIVFIKLQIENLLKESRRFLRTEVDKALKIFINFMSLFKNSILISEIFSDIKENITSFIYIIFDAPTELLNLFHTQFSKENIEECNRIFDIATLYDNLLIETFMKKVDEIKYFTEASFHKYLDENFKGTSTINKIKLTVEKRVKKLCSEYFTSQNQFIGLPQKSSNEKLRLYYLNLSYAINEIRNLKKLKFISDLPEEKILESLESKPGSRFDELKLNLKNFFLEERLMIDKSYLTMIDAYFREYDIIKYYFKIDESIDLKPNLENKMNNLSKAAEKSVNIIDDFKNHLCYIKAIGVYISVDFKAKSAIIIRNLLDLYLAKFEANGLLKLGFLLQKDPIGKIIVLQSAKFSGFDTKKFNKKVKVKTQNVKYTLDRLEGNSIDRKRLEELYHITQQDYQKGLHEFLNNEISENDVVNQIKSIKINLVDDKEIISSIKEIPKLISKIFLIWTISNSTIYFSSNDQDYLSQPHPAQIFAVLRMLNLDDSNANNLTSNFIEIKTGEGKSITLAVVATILALGGFDVDCVCYSEYLSKRDFNSFKKIYETLGLREYINYKTIKRACKDYLFKYGSVSDLVKNLFTVEDDSIRGSIFKKADFKRKSILLVDEVDVFFAPDFLNDIYSFSCLIQRPSIKILLNFLWENREISKRKTDYELCKKKILNDIDSELNGKWKALIDLCVLDIENDLNEFDEHQNEYVCQHGKIVYYDNDGFTSDVIYGYKTTFAYLFETERGSIKKGVADDYYYFIVKCGKLFYSEIPANYSFIIGVTGTLKQLKKEQLEELKILHKIGKLTFIPSVFDHKGVVFDKKKDVFLEKDESSYFERINDEINLRLAGDQRAVIVFFNNIKKLRCFLKFARDNRPNENIFILNDPRSNLSEEIIKSATFAGSITLALSYYGRGTDFMCHDKTVLKNGGVHVIQAFFSVDLSEEIQIMGRTARMGNQGSFSLVLLSEEFNPLNFPLDKIDIENIYEELDKLRPMLKGSTSTKEKKVDSQQLRLHSEKTRELLKYMETSDFPNIKNVIIDFNKVREIINIEKNLSYQKLIRTLILLDGNKSFENYRSITYSTILWIICSIYQMSFSENFDSERIYYKIVEYDNGSFGKYIRSTDWVNDTNNLKYCIDKIQPWIQIYENNFLESAISRGFKEASSIQMELKKDGDSLTQIILIGNKGILKATDVDKNLRVKKISKLNFEILQTSSIPVHTITFNERIKEEFELIAKLNNGESELIPHIGRDIQINMMYDVFAKNIFSKLRIKSEYDIKVIREYSRNEVKTYI